MSTQSIPGVKTEMLGLKFHRLLVIAEAGKNRHGKYLWKCRCDCGRELVVNGASLRNHNTKSCGCWMMEQSYKNSIGAKCLTHGMTGTSEFNIWSGMISRCYNRNDHNYHLYGARGIQVCQEWRDSFQAFFDYIGARPSKKHSIDRINNDGNYEPGNILWATSVQQNRNRRDNRLLAMNGVVKTITEWSLQYRVSVPCLRYRLKIGMSVSDALTTPANHGNKLQRTV